MDNCDYTAVVFIDLKKAFDTVDHAILLKKMGKYGIKWIEIGWFQSYLKSRSQFCRVSRKDSETRSIEVGAPHGSFLGPLLFLLYINDLLFASPVLDILEFK